MRLLIDTNADAALRRGDRQVTDLVRSADEILMSAIVIGELLFGFRGGSRPDYNVSALRGFLAARAVKFVPVTLVTAERYALVAASLRRKGKPIPTNDLWIAAHALETGADLVSSDDHFAHVEGVAWLKLGAG